MTDFELRKKANPPEPEMMRRLAKVLNWSEDEQLRAWGYELSGGDDRRGKATLTIDWSDEYAGLLGEE